jgi:hypothetical protein
MSRSGALTAPKPDGTEMSVNFVERSPVGQVRCAACVSDAEAQAPVGLFQDQVLWSANRVTDERGPQRLIFGHSRPEAQPFRRGR